MTKKRARVADSFLEGLRGEPVTASPAAEPQETQETYDSTVSYDTVLDIGDIQPHPDNRAVDIQDETARALRESVVANGFTDKVQVLTRENAEALGVTGLGPQPYVSLNCHHRLAICRAYRPDITTVEAVVRQFSTALEMLYVIVDYNAARPLRVSERARQIRRIKGEVRKTLREGEDTYSVIAQRLGKSRTLVYMLDAVGELPPALLDRVDGGDVTLREAVELRKLPPESQAALAQALGSLDPGLEPEARREATRLLLNRVRAAGAGEQKTPPPETPPRPRELTRAFANVLRALPQPGDPVALPRYQKTVAPLVENMDASLRTILSYRQQFREAYPLPPALREELRTLLEEEPE